MTDKRIFVFIGEQAFTLDDLGAAADMPIAKGLQNIVDQGLLGPQYQGKSWYEVIKSSGLKMESIPEPEETLQHCLYTDYRVQLSHCKDLHEQGLLTQPDRDLMLAKRRNWIAATKLAKL